MTDSLSKEELKIQIVKAKEAIKQLQNGVLINKLVLKAFENELNIIQKKV